MRDIVLYRALLGLTAPWTVAGVDLDMPGQRVVVRGDAGPGPYPCPECGTPGPRHDGKLRRWRHLDTMQFTTWSADVPRVECATHGVKQLRVPWAEPGSQFTALFERLAIDLLRECSITGAIRLLRISWDEGWGIKGRAVKRGLSRATTSWPPRAFALDVVACANCGGRLRLIATPHDPVVIRKLLAHLNMARSGPSLGPALP